MYLKYPILIIFLLTISYNLIGQNNNNIQDNNLANYTDTIKNEEAQQIEQKKKAKQPYQPQVRLLFDVGNFALNFTESGRKDYEFCIDYLYKNNWYLVAEGGIAKGNIDFNNLKYQTNSSYLRIGGDKSLLPAIHNRDFDIVFFGFRYGAGFGTRSEVYYEIPSQFGPTRDGQLEAQNFFVHWGEMTGGIRVELWKGIYAGWNFRARFLLNPKTFEQKLTPNYIAGYGNADKGTSFGFNIYLGYALRWQQKNAPK